MGWYYISKMSSVDPLRADTEGDTGSLRAERGTMNVEAETIERGF